MWNAPRCSWLLFFIYKGASHLKKKGKKLLKHLKYSMLSSDKSEVCVTQISFNSAWSLFIRDKQDIFFI